MSTLIPNANCWIGWAANIAQAALIPKLAELTSATELTDFIININASSTGNVVPIPKLKSAFETSIPGTTTATFTAEMYRDSVPANDTAWTTLPKAASGFFIISRFGGTGVGKKPTTGDTVEVWPVNVSSRTASALASNTAQTFTLTCSVPVVPNEAAVITAT
jgi:hypothetical protein